MRILDEKRTGSEIVAAEITDAIRLNINPAVDIFTPVLRKLEAVAPAGVPLNNMGPTYPETPYFVPHGEKNSLSVVQKTKIDWLAFSSVAGTEAIRYALQSIWPEMEINPAAVGMRGYPKCSALSVNGVQFGLMGWGAKHGRDSVSLTGTACKTMTAATIEIIYEFLKALDARITRLDIALDLYKGERTLDHAIWAYSQGRFKALKAPVGPEKRLVVSEKDGRNLGRTLYIGKRKGRLMGRIYEKGLEVFARMPEEYRELSTEREEALIQEGKIGIQNADGTPVLTVADTWVRLEAEYKYDKERPLPLEMLFERDVYFAGAYPYFADALGEADGKRPKVLRQDCEISLDRMIGNMRRAFGNTMYTLGEIGFTPAEIFEQVSTGTHNQKLLKSGVFAVAQAAADRVKFEGQISQVDDCPF